MTLVKFTSEGKKSVAASGCNNVFNSIFNDTFFSDRPVTNIPAVNICETKDHFRLELAAPGLKKEDFRLNLKKNLLSISVENNDQTDQQHRYSKQEFSYIDFVREFTWPDSANIDAIDAKYRDGVLYIDIPKREQARMLTRQIEIK